MEVLLQQAPPLSLLFCLNRFMAQANSKEPKSTQKPILIGVLLIPFLALLTALVAGAAVMLAFGDDPILAYQGLFRELLEVGALGVSLFEK